ncbi:hypothetical protein VVR26_00880 [Corynebacterium camporealensis]|uniref:hypothetical protein n=1 Tax=Corynebacterium camporealensis TaxID=161896 RepID=UPI0034CEC728
MKLFSRKALVAGATAVAVSFAGTTVATAEDTKTTAPTTETTPNATNDQEPPKGNEGSSNNGEGSSEGEVKTEDIIAWIGVFTAVISALGTLFGFLDKYFDFF